MRYLAFIPLFFLSIILSAQPLSVMVDVVDNLLPPGNDTIYHEQSNKLLWNNFNATPVMSGNTAALTSSGFGFGAMMMYKNEKGTLKITAYCFFDKSKSWVKPNQKTDYILQHEQHHFDVSRIGMQNFISELRRAKFTVQNYSSLIDKLYYECYNSMSKLQRDYDDETMNGRLKDKQAEWQTKIDRQLAASL